MKPSWELGNTSQNSGQHYIRGKKTNHRHLSGHSYYKMSVLSSLCMMETEAAVPLHILENMPFFECRCLTHVGLTWGPPDASEHADALR